MFSPLPVRTRSVSNSSETRGIHREFDAISQRSIRNLTAAMVVPDLLSGETVHDDAGNHRAMLLEYLDARAVVVLDEPALMRSSLEESLAANGTGQGVLEELEGVLRLFRQVHMLSMPDPRRVGLDFGAVPQPAFNGSVRVLRSTIADLLEQTIFSL